MNPKSSGVYRIRNVLTNDLYIGSCANKYGFKARFRQHKHELKNQKHHSIHLQRAWNKYGEENFVFEIMEITPRENALALEQIYLDLYKPRYNIAKMAGSTLGVKLSAETCIRIGNSKRGIKYTLEQIASKCKKVTDQHGNIYPSISHAARAIGSHLSCVQNVIKGKHSHAKGYIFKLVKE